MYHLDFPSSSFDTVTMDQVLTEADEPLRVLEEASRLIRPGGNLLLVVYQAEEKNRIIFKDPQVIEKQLKQYRIKLDQLKILSGGQGKVLVIRGERMRSNKDEK